MMTPLRLDNLPPDLEERFGKTARAMLAEREREQSAGLDDSADGQDDERDEQDDAPAGDGGRQRDERAADDVFADADLDGDAAQPCRRYVMPGGKVAWVFPCSGADLALAARWSGQLPAKMSAAEQNVYGMAMQVLIALRKNESGERIWQVFDPRFEWRKHVQRVLSSKTLTSEVITEIVTISSRLGRGREYLPPHCLRLLRETAGLLESWSSASSVWEDCPAGLRQTTTDCASRLRRAILLDGSPE